VTRLARFVTRDIRVRINGGPDITSGNADVRLTEAVGAVLELMNHRKLNRITLDVRDDAARPRPFVHIRQNRNTSEWIVTCDEHGTAVSAFGFNSWISWSNALASANRHVRSHLKGTA
jgi:hypothetical protein